MILFDGSNNHHEIGKDFSRFPNQVPMLVVRLVVI